MKNRLDELEQTLKWFHEMGVDEAIMDEPHDYTRKVLLPDPQHHEKSKNTIYANISNSTESIPSNVIYDTNKIAEECTTIEQLSEKIKSFKGLSITKTATNTVISDGNPNSKIMMIGEAPGADEDIQGVPFCGASGKLLDQMLSCIGLFRKDNFYITNTVFWRPPGNRKPTPEELEICFPFVERHIYLFKPKMIILIGATAVTSILGIQKGITKIRGKFFEYNNKYLKEPVKVMPIFHPSYLLRSPGQKKFSWQDMLTIKDYLRDKEFIQK